MVRLVRVIEHDGKMWVDLEDYQKLLKDYEDMAKQAGEVTELPEHDGCSGCCHELEPANSEPCRSCKQSYTDKYKA